MLVISYRQFRLTPTAGLALTVRSPHDVTQLLLAWSDGNQAALEKLVPLVYGELHSLAKRYMAREQPGHLLQTTELVNEVYIKLVDSNHMTWRNRAHFFAVSAQLMRRILIDHARSRRSLKRGAESPPCRSTKLRFLLTNRARIWERWMTH